MGKFNPSEILLKLRYIEENFPVESWRINDLKVWPYIRTSLAYSQNRNVNTRPLKKIKQGRLKVLISKLNLILTFPIRYLKFRKDLQSATRIFAGANTHCALQNGEMVNKYFEDEIEKLINENNPPLYFDNSKIINKKRAHFEWIHSLPVVYAVSLIPFRFGSSKKVAIELKDYALFFDYVKKEFNENPKVKILFSEVELTKRLISLYEKKEFIKSLLKNSKISIAFFLCYYSSLYYPLLAACKELGIDTVDIQHGGIGQGHYCYDQWNCPATGYEFLPRYFWTWDEPTANLINKWASKTNFHKAYFVGNPWLQKSLVSNAQPSTPKPYILYNMTEVLLDDFIVQSILQSSPSHVWVLRMHPRQYVNNWKLQQQINELEITDRVIIENTHTVPLSISIINCHVFISRASGSIIECIALGITPILLRSEITGYYQHYVEQGSAILLEQDNTENLLEAINLFKDKQVDISKRKVPTDLFRKFEEMIQL